MRFKAIPDKKIIPIHKNPIFQYYTHVFDLALNRDIKETYDSTWIKDIYVPFQDDKYELFNFEYDFKKKIDIRFNEIEESINNIVNEEAFLAGLKGNLYLLIGKIGSGKTTFFLHYIAQNINTNTCYIDLSSLATPMLPTRKMIEE